MKNVYKFYMFMALFIIATISLSYAGINDRFSNVQLEEGNSILVPEVTVAPATPPVGYTRLYSLGNAMYFLDDAGVTTSIIAAAAGGVANLDQAYDAGGAGAGANIAVDSGPVIFTGTHAATNTVNITASGTGHALSIANTGSGKDISGSAGWSVTKAGLGTFASFGATTVIANMLFDDGATDSPSLTFKDQTDETASFLKTDAGVLGLTTDATDGLDILVGNLWVGNGAPGTAPMDGEDAYIEGALEVDGPAEFDNTVNIDGAFSATSTSSFGAAITLENGMTIDNTVNNSYRWIENAEDIVFTFGGTSLDIDSTTGIVEIQLFDGSTGTITHAADSGADDFTLSVTGAQDSSLILSSTGTGADALQVTTTAGGIDISATGVAGEDVDITAVTSSVHVISNEAIADAVTLASTAGGIDISTAATYDIDMTATLGTVKVIASEAAADQFKVDAQGVVAGDAITLETTDGGIMLNADGATEGDIEANAAGSIIVNAAEAVATAVTILAPAGGIDITSAATFDIDVTATGGKVLVIASEAAADQFKVDATGVIVGDAINLETTDGGIMINADGVANGDIEINAGDALEIISTGTTSINSSDWDISATGAATNMASIGFDSGAVLYTDKVEISNAQLKDLAGNPRELVATPGADVFVEVVSVVFILDYGSNVLTESADDLVVQYGTSGDDITAAIEMTGFIDAAADTTMTVYPVHPQAANAAADLLNNPITLLNTSGDFGGNVAADTTMTVYITYRLITAGL